MSLSTSWKRPTDSPGTGFPWAGRAGLCSLGPSHLPAHSRALGTGHPLLGTEIFLLPIYPLLFKPSSAALQLAADGAANFLPRLLLPIRFPAILLSTGATQNF